MKFTIILSSPPTNDLYNTCFKFITALLKNQDIIITGLFVQNLAITGFINPQANKLLLLKNIPIFLCSKACEQYNLKPEAFDNINNIKIIGLAKLIELITKSDRVMKF